jgi:hypothetical protein
MFHTRKFHSIYSDRFVLKHAKYISKITFLCIYGVFWNWFDNMILILVNDFEDNNL